MISFYPGPSKLFPEVRNYFTKIYDSGILSVNHRSVEFVALSKSCIGLLKSNLNIPEDYTVFFTSSATECWEIIAQSLIKETSCHIYNGAFGEKWADYTSEIIGVQNCTRIPFGVNELPELLKYTQLNSASLIALTHNETSNATALTTEYIQSLKNDYPDTLIAIDATSSMAGIQLPYSEADIWFASVQKCFGMPAGMAIMICSSRVRKKCLKKDHHYNSLSAMFEKMDVWQTTYTPNVLSIALLENVLIGRNWEDKSLINRANTLYNFFESNPQIGTLLVQEPSLRSNTVIAIQASEEQITNIKSKAKQAGFLLGNGYGKWAKTTFRIANFPAISDEEIELLLTWFKSEF